MRHGANAANPLGALGIYGEAAAGKAGDALVFVKETVAERSRIQVSRSMRRLCAAAKIAPLAVFHDLRRSYGSVLLNAGADEVIQ